MFSSDLFNLDFFLLMEITHAIQIQVENVDNMIYVCHIENAL